MKGKPLIALIVFTIASATLRVGAAENAPGATRLVIHAGQAKETISRNIYGHFSEHLGHCIYGGIWVGESSPVPNTRGIGPREARPAMVNTHWGGVVENNHFGTHEFLDLCEQLGCEPYICGNVGSGTVQEMQEWVEYITFDGKSPMADLRRANGRDEPW